MNVRGIGTDIVECLRIAKMMERHGDQFINRVYSDAEIEYCQRQKAATQHFAGRWAAKEAILKALGTGWVKGLSWRDIEIANQRGGEPVVRFRGGAADVAARAGVAEIKISISHCRSHAMAFAIALAHVEDDDSDLDIDLPF